ncbi:MAG: 50S ribosomal protein L29 [Candidatus Omnitrophota bacterium]
MKVKELRDLTKQELLANLSTLRKKLMELNFQRKTQRVEKPHLFKQVRKDIARTLTFIKEKADE